MSMILLFRSFIIGCALSLAVSSVFASEVKGHPCANINVEQVFNKNGVCEGFILGFLEGALLTDAAIINSLAGERSDFMDRVYKTRGVISSKTPAPTYLAKFCLPEPLDKAAVIKKVFQDLKTSPKNNIGADEKVYAAFIHSYPCS